MLSLQKATHLPHILAFLACSDGLLGVMQIKMHWVCANYWKSGPDGNDIHKTNVPNLRMRFRYDCHTEELNLVMSGAAAHEARRHIKSRE